ncbi:hypothetical protein MAMMFC1_01501 [Methylomusa anaerophila]|uniref:Uncharacterized protein n=1 Tax=Methylomusa anaerophila TaxID=1930071 RepID=A0A348AIE0_9FIRM|nr:hypothetical protein MAMMFC1_01501 [Methylomusa anaerophila]
MIFLSLFQKQQGYLLPPTERSMENEQVRFL